METASAFDSLIAAVGAHPEQPQSLLFVFADTELFRIPSTEQCEGFDASAHRYLRPLMCIEKLIDEITTFQALVEEARTAGPPWRIMFATALAGQDGLPPAPKLIGAALTNMIESIRAGTVEGFLAFSTSGELLSLP